MVPSGWRTVTSILEIRSMLAWLLMFASKDWLVLVMSSLKLKSSIRVPGALKLNDFALAVSGLKLTSPMVEDTLL